MYPTLDFSEKVKVAEAFIISNDRELFVEYLKFIEEYVSDKPIMFSGQVATELLNELPISRDSYQFELYTQNPYQVAKELSVLIYKKFKDHSPFIPIHTLALDTLIKNTELSISIGGRVLVKFISFGEYRGVNLVEAVQPVKLKARFSDHSVLVIPADLYLIQALRVLYTPALCDQWESNATYIDKLLPKALEKKVSGAGFINVKAAEEKTLSVLKAIGAVLIGDFAVNKLVSSPISRLQAIYGNQETTSDTGDDVSFIVDYIRRKCDVPEVTKDGFKIEAVKYFLNLPSDFRIVKHTVYITNKDNKFPLVDLFNSATYEQIPFRLIDGYRIGAPFVCMRFVLIDLWILKLIEKLTNKSNNSNNPRKDVLLSNLAKLGELPREFQLDDYYGVYLNENVARKQLMKSLGMAPRFYPINSFPEDLELLRGKGKKEDVTNKDVKEEVKDDVKEEKDDIKDEEK